MTTQPIESDKKIYTSPKCPICKEMIAEYRGNYINKGTSFEKFICDKCYKELYDKSNN